ncbi:GNAT family N-acetyltransferase [Thermotoga caldifontis]|uniref:GNAT family N-acetyltransferase n=1 Tax=Thermotoga caldifontis TaxID=1508419 RepID=UPI00149410F5|nr:GNAT family N-acetyltransferase [Thermotoga caldifontis]
MDGGEQRWCSDISVEVDGKFVGWMTLGMEGWNDRLRIHELLVLEQYRRKGVGQLLLDKAKQVAKQKGCRAIVLEMNNFGAIQFYKKQGFKLNGCDTTAHRNDDAEQNEVRIDMVYRLEDE